MKKVTAVPITFLTILKSPWPTDWAIRMLAAMLIPKIEPSIIIMTMLELPMAVMALTPRVWLTQNWLTLPFSDCSALPPSTGSENTSRVLVIGPSTSSRLCLPPRPPPGPRDRPGGLLSMVPHALHLLCLGTKAGARPRIGLLPSRPLV